MSIPKKVDVDTLWDFEEQEMTKFIEIDEEIHKIKNDIFKALRTLD